MVSRCDFAGEGMFVKQMEVNTHSHIDHIMGNKRMKELVLTKPYSLLN
jgi:hypothetical protein